MIHVHIVFAEDKVMSGYYDNADEGSDQLLDAHNLSSPQMTLSEDDVKEVL